MPTTVHFNIELICNLNAACVSPDELHVMLLLALLFVLAWLDAVDAVDRGLFPFRHLYLSRISSVGAHLEVYSRWILMQMF